MLGRRGPSLRLAAMLGAMLLVLAAMARLEQPSTHRAIGRVFGEAAYAGVVAPNDAAPVVDEGIFSEVKDNAPFRNSEQAAWFATIEAVSNRSAAELSSRSSGLVGYAALSSQPDSYRGRVISVSGTVRRIEEVIPAENKIGIDRLWRVTIEPAGGEVWPLTVYTLAKPQDASEPYDAAAVGVFFKNLSYRWAEGVGITPVIVAKRLETTLEASRVVAAELVTPEPVIDFAKPASGSLGRALLADLGVDLTRLDDVVDRRRLTSKDTVVFYDVLDAAAKTPATQLVRLARAGLDDYIRRHAERADDSLRDRQTLRELEAARERQRYSVVPLFGDGSQERGELVTIDAVVRRAVRIDASGSDAANERGIDHYYELEAFPEDSQNLPIVFVVRELPTGFPVGDAIRQPARLAGFFFKQWAYRTRKRSNADPTADRRQFAPLLIGRAPIPLAIPDAAAGRPGLALGLAATVGLVGIVVALWRLNRRDAAYESATLSRYRRHRDDQPLDFERLADASESP
ncbi:MAG: hypothetical protein AAF266_10045 [Planctomycetota bacterium]